MPSACAPSVYTVNVPKYIIITKSLAFDLTFRNLINVKEKFYEDLEVIVAEN